MLGAGNWAGWPAHARSQRTDRQAQAHRECSVSKQVGFNSLCKRSQEPGRRRQCESKVWQQGREVLETSARRDAMNSTGILCDGTAEHGGMKDESDAAGGVLAGSGEQRQLS